MSPSTLRRYEEGLRIGRELIEKFRDRFPAAMACLEEDLKPAFNASDFPRNTTSASERPTFWSVCSERTEDASR